MLLPLALAAGAALLVVTPAANSGPVEDGEAAFKQSCSGCHTYGGGDSAGPDLQGVIGRVGEEQVRAWIATPEKVIASGDPEVAALVKKFGGVEMPNLGLAAPQVDALVAYFAAQEAGGGGGGETTPPPSTDKVKGDAAAGKRLFTGERQFANGGPSCVSCHQLAGADVPVGGRVGPDLTGAYEKYGGATGLGPVLASLPFPSMQPIYGGNPLTPQEQADLAAFLGTTAGAQPRDDETWLLVAVAVVIAAGFLGLMLLVWPRRRLVVRRTIAPTSSPRRH